MELVNINYLKLYLIQLDEFTRKSDIAEEKISEPEVIVKETIQNEAQRAKHCNNH